MRVLQNTPATITETWYTGDTIADPGTVAVTVKSDDGTTLASGSATGTGAAARSFNLNSTVTQDLDRLTVTWASPSLGTLTSTVDVAGGFYFTLTELRAQSKAVANITTYPAAALADMRDTVEDAIEDACGRAFVPRYRRAALSGDGTTLLRGLPMFLRAVRSGTTTTSGATTALTPSDLSLLSLSSAGFVAGYSWPSGYGNVTVGFEYGMDEPPARVKRAALLLAKVWLVSGPIDDRANTFTSTDGGTYSLVTAGRGGSVFGVPEVDATVDQYRVPAVA